MQQGEQLFGKRSALMSLWQAQAENFYPERADFTATRNMGDTFMDNLMTSYPVIARRDLGNAFSSMLRPSSKNWMHIRTSRNWDTLGVEARQWLEWAEGRMRRAMAHRTSQFTRATKEGDHDFATFGQTVIQTTLNTTATGLLYRCWHLRDVAWMEDDAGMTTTVYRRWKPSIRMLASLFGKDKLHKDMVQKLEKEPYCEGNIWHVILPSDHCEYGEPTRMPFKSVYLDVDHKHIIEEVGIFEQEYTIPRWQTVSGSQYAYSPATVCALPDARLIQSMTAVLLEAGEKAVSPPLLATQEAIRGDINVYAGGITFIDSDYDERLGEVLRPITQDKSGATWGMEMARDTRNMIAEAFYLNKITLPPPENSMTAYEVGQRIQEYIRQAMPLFDPMEQEYNAPLCEITFNKMLRAGAFGSPMNMPDELRGEHIDFSFESPLHDAAEREKGQRFIETGQMLAQAVQLDPSTAHIVDASTALRDVLKAVGVPAKWTRSEGAVKALVDAEKQAQQSAQLLSTMQQGADVVRTLKDASPVAPPL
jgi:hypothetical protein